MGAPVRFQKAVPRTKKKRRGEAPIGAPVRVMGRLFPSAEGTGFAARLSHRVRRSAPALVGASPPRTGGHFPKAAGRPHPPGTMEHDSMKPAGHQTVSRDAATLSPAASAMSLFRRGALRSRMSGGDVVDRRLHATL